MHRLFVGLRPSRHMREKLLNLMGGIAGARWQDEGQLHLTLKFIGEVDHNQAEDVAAALGGISFPALDLALNGVGTFDKKGLHHTLWAGVTPHEAVTILHHKIEQACASIGVAREVRSFFPHITLARMNRSTGPVDNFVEAHGGLSSAPERFHHFILYESLMGHGGSFYEPVARYPLR